MNSSAGFRWGEALRLASFLLPVHDHTVKAEGKKWFEGLKQFILDCRQKRPLPNRESLTAEQEVQCQIIGGNFISWLTDHGPQLIQERAAFSAMEGWEKDPFVVFTSNEPGLVAAREILQEGADNIAFLFPVEFEEWLKLNPDTKYQWHIHTWSYFCDKIDEDSLKDAQKYPIPSSDKYWLHKDGTMCGKLFGRGGDHLWQWEGKEPTLLEEAIHQWVS